MTTPSPSALEAARKALPFAWSQCLCAHGEVCRGCKAVEAVALAIDAAVAKERERIVDAFWSGLHDSEGLCNQCRKHDCVNRRDFSFLPNPIDTKSVTAAMNVAAFPTCDRFARRLTSEETERVR